jgi:predicted nuclease of restriction endonuclease-like RecB superfamily
MACLFSDLPDERVLTAIAPTTPEQLALLGNSELIAKLLTRALRVRIWANGHVRALVRQAKLMGLLCNVTGAANDESILDISGPFSLFRHTRIYAWALAALVPRLAWCHRFRLEADCVLSAGDKVGRLHLRSGDPIFPARQLPPCDSLVERRFTKGFAALAPEWDVIREPVAVAVGDGLIFPDFELRQRATGERWLLEIVGYWTPEYLRKKYAGLRAAQIKNLILCIDEARCCDDKALEVTELVVRYRRHVDPRDVLAIVDPRAHALLPAAAPKRRRAPSKGKRCAPT